MSPSQEWDVTLVKERLPDVRVQMPDGRILLGTVRGREEAFARVTVETSRRVFATAEYPWSSLVWSLNTGRPLSI
jgi:hypothetical protein